MDKIVLFDNKKDCCGCGLCSKICPRGAITMLEDENGFVFPVIDSNKCIKCGLCLKRCTLKNEKKANEKKEVYVGATKDSKLIKKSSSGAIFATLATQFIKDGGVVIGCNMVKKDNKFVAEHIVINDIKDIHLIQGSKYVQSNVSNIFLVIKKYLSDGIKVLFSGTACQVSALYSYLNKEEKSLLYCVDIVCHGVPSQKIFNDYIKYIEKKNKIKILDFIFRDKSITWKHCGYIKYRNSNNVICEKRFIPQISSYYKLFLDKHIFRESCYNCHYANANRVSDITLGDFWGIEQEQPEVLKENGGKIDKNNGISFLCVNTENGKKLLDNIKDKIYLYKSDYDKAAKHNKQLIEPISMPKLRKKILQQYEKKGYKGIEKSYKRYVGAKLPIYYLKNKKLK